MEATPFGRYPGHLRGSTLDAEKVGSDCLCGNDGGDSHGERTKFAGLKATHADNHLHATEVVRVVQSGQREEALNLLQKGEYS